MTKKNVLIEKAMRFAFAGTILFLVMSTVFIYPAVPTFLFVLAVCLFGVFGVSFCFSTMMLADAVAQQSQREKIVQPLTPPKTDLHYETCQQEKE